MGIEHYNQEESSINADAIVGSPDTVNVLNSLSCSHLFWWNMWAIQKTPLECYYVRFQFLCYFITSCFFSLSLSLLISRWCLFLSISTWKLIFLFKWYGYWLLLLSRQNLRPPDKLIGALESLLQSHKKKETAFTKCQVQTPSSSTKMDEWQLCDDDVHLPGLPTMLLSLWINPTIALVNSRKRRCCAFIHFIRNFKSPF